MPDTTVCTLPVSETTVQRYRVAAVVFVASQHISCKKGDLGVCDLCARSSDERGYEVHNAKL
jgi:hypothetical protein